METKSVDLLELKTNSTPGEFTAKISAIGNVDRQGDKVMPGAFAKAMAEDPIPPVYWSHKHDIPPIGEGLEWKEAGDAILYTGRLFVKGDVEHEVANQVYAGMKSYEGRPPAIRQWSYTYGVPDGGSENVMEEGKSIRLLHEIRPVIEVGPCFIGANPETATVQAAKSLALAGVLASSPDFDFFQLGEKATWGEAYINSLPDSSFLYIGSGGSKDDSGKTAPRDLRHFPYKDANGSIDMPHLRNAISLAPQADSLSTEVQARVQARAQRILRAQEGKAILLGTIFSGKAWDDVAGRSVGTLLDMLDSATTFIQLEQDPDDVAAMQTIGQSLIQLLQSEFTEEPDDDADDNSSGMSYGMNAATFVALDTAIKLYEIALDVSSSDGASTLTKQEIARLLIARPSH